MMRYAGEGVGEAMADVVGSISEITTQRYDDKTMLANYGHIQPTLKTPKAILAKIQEIKQAVAAITGREGLYLRGMTAAFETYAHILNGEAISYQEACLTMQQVRLDAIPQQRYDALAERVDEGLAALGYRGDTGKKVSDWLLDTRIPPQAVVDAANAYLDKAKARAVARVVALPEQDGIEAVQGVTGVFWSGFSRYIGDFRGDLSFNIDRLWSLPTFVNVLCHEGYPGHQAFYCHWDDLFRRGQLPLEAAYYSTAGNPANPMFEGAPECGLHFLGWDDPEADTPEITLEQKKIFALGRDVLDLQRMVQTQACYLYHVQGEKEESIVKYMRDSHIFTEVEARNSLRFFDHPVQRYYYPAYYYGRWMVYEAYARIAKEKRPEFFHFLYDLPHTNETFCQGIAAMTGEPFMPFASR